MLFAAYVLAHQGGWDEITFVLVPLVAFAALLVLARRRVARMERADAASVADAEPDTDTDVDSDTAR